VCACAGDFEEMKNVDNFLEKLFRSIIDIPKYQFDTRQVELLVKLANTFKEATDKLEKRVKENQNGKDFVL
jgi:hypothetical protein